MDPKDWPMDTYNTHINYCPKCREQYIGDSKRKECFTCAGPVKREQAHNDYVKKQFDLDKIDM